MFYFYVIVGAGRKGGCKIHVSKKLFGEMVLVCNYVRVVNFCASAWGVKMSLKNEQFDFFVPNGLGSTARQLV